MCREAAVHGERDRFTVPSTLIARADEVIE
jgi:hypothetical protein